MWKKGGPIGKRKKKGITRKKKKGIGGVFPYGEGKGECPD